MPGFGLNSWTTGDAVDAATDIRVAGAAGYQFVELRDWKIEQHLAQGGRLATLREQARQSGIGVLSVNTLDDCTLHSGAKKAALIERCRRLCEWAEELAAPYVIVGPSYQSEPPIEAATVHARSAEALRDYAHVAADYGVAIAFEFHGYARCSINSLSSALDVLAAVETPNLGVVIDAFHFYVGGSRLEDLARLGQERLAIVHLADVDHADRSKLGKPNRVLPGEGVLPVKDLVAAVKRLGYRGAYSLELFREEYWAMDPMIVARKGLASMQRFV
jgi:2-keto-myo-inositol isomerase